MDQGRPEDSSIRLAELVAALSVATDLAMSQPLEYALRSCIVAVRLADALGFDDNGLHAVDYQALLRYIGCNAETLTMAALVGDEMAIRQGFSTIDPGRQKDVIGLLLTTIRKSNSGASAVQMVRAVARGLLGSNNSTKPSPVIARSLNGLPRGSDSTPESSWLSASCTNDVTARASRTG